MAQKIPNNARALLATNISAVATSLTVEAGKADTFAVANTSDWLTPANWFKATIEDSSGNIEIIKVGTRTSGSGVFSVLLRGQEGTTARAFTAGAVVETRLTSEDVENAVNAPSVFSPSMVPVGGIVMYGGVLASLPANWKVCDGTAGTPDLRDKFIVGVSGTKALAATGGSADAVVVSHDHAASTGSESADHTHSGTTSAVGDHQHVSVAGGGTADGSALGTSAGSSYPTPWGFASGSPSQSTSAAGGHSHSFTSGGRSAAHTHSVTVTAIGVSGADKNLPPYYALYYIKRVS